MMESLMRKFYSFLILFLIISCSTNSSKIKKRIHEETIQVHPGGVVQVFLPDFFEGKNIKCTNGKFPVSGEQEKFFIYAESYFSDMNKKECNSEGVKVVVIVKEKIFPFEELKVDRKRVNLNKKDLSRVLREREVLRKTYSSQSPSSKLYSNFSLPLNSKITSEYGKRRLFNKERKGQHLGIDFRAKVGKEIVAANDGTVVLASELFYTGNTVILYHGMGIFTTYGHLSKIKTSKGIVIKKGDIIGFAGMTGRVTGPHLHWGVKVNGQWVNGKDLLKLNFL